jgi:hypothetical protein
LNTCESKYILTSIPQVRWQIPNLRFNRDEKGINYWHKLFNYMYIYVNYYNELNVEKFIFHVL